MSVVSKDVVLPAPPERVFAALVEPAQRAAWVRTLLEAPRAESLRQGDRVDATRRGSTSGSRYVLTVTRLDAPRVLATDVARNGQHVGRNTFELTPTPDGTRVRATAEIQLSGLQRMMTSMVVAAAEKELVAELDALRAHVANEGKR